VQAPPRESTGGWVASPYRNRDREPPLWRKSCRVGAAVRDLQIRIIFRPASFLCEATRHPHTGMLVLRGPGCWPAKSAAGAHQASECEQLRPARSAMM